jgi:hypothetical protein
MEAFVYGGCVMKYFGEEVEKIFERLKSGQRFAFSKYADGEWAAMQGTYVNNGEFESSLKFSEAIEELKESFTYKDAGYYVGISCPCCQGKNHDAMVLASGQDYDHLTFANMFVNNNYSFFKEKFIPEFSNHQVHLVANEKSKIKNLPFGVEEFYPVGFNAWVEDRAILDEILEQDLTNKLFLFCCGPFGNILTHRLWKENRNNTYLDIGSTLNPYLECEGFVRGYFSGPNSKKVCVWGD